MSRPAGARNHDFDEKRSALLNTLTDYGLNAALTRPSLRQFAIAAGQSEPTLRHYFGDRQHLVIEIVEEIARRASAVWSEVAKPAAGPVPAVREYLAFAEKGMMNGASTRAHAFGLIEGFADPVVGRVYLDVMLQPSLEAFSEKLQATPGTPTDPSELHAATLVATAPIILIGLLQVVLGGGELPMHVGATFEHLQDLLSRAFSAPAE
ncbi:MAG: TetR/AcrR family transcriptional regulator [Acidobacteria bacterium]|nr:TetR/AcrR family transcriptional regulator [Acidobacteriota bacterium]